MCGHDFPDPIDTPPDDDEPAEAVRVTCWHCGGDGSAYIYEGRAVRCEACGGTGYTYETAETEEDENED